MSCFRRAPLLAARTTAVGRQLTYSERQARLGRPLSPHVTVYKQPMTAVASITNRVTGVLLAVGCVGIGTLGIMGQDVTEPLEKAREAVPGFTAAAKFLVAFPLVMHGLLGVRHLVSTAPWAQHV